MFFLFSTKVLPLLHVPAFYHQIVGGWTIKFGYSLGWKRRRCFFFTLFGNDSIFEKRAMEDSFSVSSPRGVLSFSKKRRATVSFADPDKASGFGISGQQGPKPLEVYGFVGSITTVVATVIFFVWAYVPEAWLHSMGIYYYPNRYWALVLPTYVMVAIALGLIFYLGLNFMSTPAQASCYTIFDEFSKDPSDFVPEGDEKPIEPISDIDLYEINDLMFGYKM
ncbi:hypothetical protein K2173_012227 [Erythroxylum novogranatense]|uniref:PIG-P domain-containing protein n=1 Tax=Erythroxylum novogranatense TaxID=1862640 RepID=A0AAV8T950_9ROSI|nr:hypothetical protein K2173_012227 [Erythroxylum novogranatense]